MKIHELKEQVNRKLKRKSEPRPSARMSLPALSDTYLVDPGDHADLARVAHMRPDLVSVPMPANRPPYARDQTETIAHRFAFKGYAEVNPVQAAVYMPTPCNSYLSGEQPEDQPAVVAFGPFLGAGGGFSTANQNIPVGQWVTEAKYIDSSPTQWEEPGYSHTNLTAPRQAFQLSSGLVVFEIAPQGLGSAVIRYCDPTVNKRTWSYARPPAGDGTLEEAAPQDHECWVGTGTPSLEEWCSQSEPVTVPVGGKYTVVMRIPAQLCTDWFDYWHQQPGDTTASPNSIAMNPTILMRRGLAMLHVRSIGANCSVSIKGFYDMHVRVRTSSPILRRLAAGSVKLDQDLLDVHAAGYSVGLGINTPAAIADAVARDLAEEKSSGRDTSTFDHLRSIPVVSDMTHLFKTSVHDMPKDVAAGIRPAEILGGVAAVAAVAGAGKLAYDNLTADQKAKITSTAKDTVTGAGKLLDGVMNLAGTAGDGLNAANTGIRSAVNLFAKLVGRV